jgi:transposase-like protein
LAKIYKAPNLSTAEANLKSFTEKREKLYPTVTKSWNENRAELSVYFVYSDKIRKLIYTTNIIESNNAKLRKVVRK